MSGGTFNYQQRSILEIAEELEDLILFDNNYSNDVQLHMAEAVKILKKAYVYANRIDWLLSGDDSEDSFLERLKEDINKIENG